MPPIVDRVDFFMEKKLALMGRKACRSFYPKCSVDHKYAKNALAARAPAQTPLGELTTLPKTP